MTNGDRDGARSAGMVTRSAVGTIEPYPSNEHVLSSFEMPAVQCQISMVRSLAAHDERQLVQPRGILMRFPELREHLFRELVMPTSIARCVMVVNERRPHG